MNDALDKLEQTIDGFEADLRFKVAETQTRCWALYLNGLHRIRRGNDFNTTEADGLWRAMNSIGRNRGNLRADLHALEARDRLTPLRDALDHELLGRIPELNDAAYNASHNKRSDPTAWGIAKSALESAEKEASKARNIRDELEPIEREHGELFQR